jgi:pimeloyl-ACP methyl ester carboxylesterase
MLGCVQSSRENSRRAAGVLAAGVGALALGCMTHDSVLPPAVERSGVAVAEVPGRELAYYRAGDPSAIRVIYVHGTPGDALGWKSYLASPVAGTESVAVDRLGFGASRSSTAANGAVVSFEEQAAAIRKLLVVRGGRGTVLVGHSLGGPISCRIAAENPGEVAGLVLLAPSVDPDLESWRWYNRLADTALVRWALPREMAVANEEIKVAAAEERALAPILSRIRCPVIVIHGSADRLVPVGNAPWLRGMLSGAARVDVRIMEGEGHFIPWKREAEVRAAVAELGAAVPAGPHAP